VPVEELVSIRIEISDPAGTVAGPAAVHVSLLVNVFRVQPMISVLPVINDTRLPLGGPPGPVGIRASTASTAAGAGLRAISRSMTEFSPKPRVAWAIWCRVGS
jgi:hypothetical protein